MNERPTVPLSRVMLNYLTFGFLGVLLVVVVVEAVRTRNDYLVRLLYKAVWVTLVTLPVPVALWFWTERKRLPGVSAVVAWCNRPLKRPPLAWHHLAGVVVNIGVIVTYKVTRAGAGIPRPEPWNATGQDVWRYTWHDPWGILLGVAAGMLTTHFLAYLHAVRVARTKGLSGV